jgi:hypothetical protein
VAKEEKNHSGRESFLLKTAEEEQKDREMVGELF